MKYLKVLLKIYKNVLFITLLSLISCESHKNSSHKANNSFYVPFHSNSEKKMVSIKRKISRLETQKKGLDENINSLKEKLYEKEISVIKKKFTFFQNDLNASTINKEEVSTLFFEERKALINIIEISKDHKHHAQILLNDILSMITTLNE